MCPDYIYVYDWDLTRFASIAIKCLEMGSLLKFKRGFPEFCMNLNFLHDILNTRANKIDVWRIPYHLPYAHLADGSDNNVMSSRLWRKQCESICKDRLFDRQCCAGERFLHKVLWSVSCEITSIISCHMTIQNKLDHNLRRCKVL